MGNKGKLITPTKEFQNNFNDLLQQIADFMNVSQEKGFKLSIDARLDLDYKTLKGELYKPLIDVESTDYFDRKEVGDA